MLAGYYSNNSNFIYNHNNNHISKNYYNQNVLDTSPPGTENFQYKKKKKLV